MVCLLFQAFDQKMIVHYLTQILLNTYVAMKFLKGRVGGVNGAIIIQSKKFKRDDNKKN